MTTEEKKIKIVSGAGFIIFKADKPAPCGIEPQILALVTHSGLYDIPKGHIEKNESSLDAAKRECFEECSLLIQDNDILFETLEYTNGPLSTFCAKNDGTPTITVNPETGIMEHKECKWVSRDHFLANCLDYLKPAVEYFYSAYDNDYNP